jgi:hypothetical protein
VIFAEDWKFRSSLVGIKDIIKLRQVWFSAPTEFNDPFDCQVDIDGTFASVRELLPIHHNAHLLSLVKDAKQHAETHKYAYFCTCKAWDVTLMWSHYANSHKGIALGFSFSPDSPFAFRELNYKEVVYSSAALKEAIAKSNDSLNMHRAYPRNYPGLMNTEADAFFEIFRCRGLELYEAIRFMKAECWKYECEYRYEVELPRPDDKGITRRFSPSDLKHVIVGVAFPESDLAELEALFSDAEWRHVKLWRAVPDAVNLKLKAEPL